MNEVLRLSLMTDAASGKKKTGQRERKISLSRQVERRGVASLIPGGGGHRTKPLHSLRE
jgi:hypothetical protein